MNVWYWSTASSSHRAASASCRARRPPGASHGAALGGPGGLVPVTPQRALPAAGAVAAGAPALGGPGGLVPVTPQRALPAAGAVAAGAPALGGPGGLVPFTPCWPLIRTLSTAPWIAERAGGITMRNQLDRGYDSPA